MKLKTILIENDMKIKRHPKARIIFAILNVF